mgnify:CR=1 FL=1
MEESPLVGEVYLRSLIDAFPSPVFIVDENLVIHDANRASTLLFAADIPPNINRLCGDSIKCVHEHSSTGGCGSTPWCPECIVRQLTKAVLEGGLASKQIANMTLLREGQPKDVRFLVSGAPFPYAGKEYILLTFEDVTELTELRRIIPICSLCRKVRNDADYWQQVEDYLAKYSSLKFSHGLCPECIEKHYTDDV